jgi:antitoxin Phd
MSIMTTTGATKVKTIAAREAKANFARLLDDAQREPVTIAKKGRAVAVVLSITDYERLEALESAYWGERAKEAEREGSLGPQESERTLAQAFDAEG